ncbi:MAG: 4Fe-4S binding protein [Nitrospirota bacterium]
MIMIDRELCKGCGYCLDACPLGLIIIEEKFNTKGVFPAHAPENDKCTGCQMCAAMCPEIAIEVYRE